MDLSKTYYVIVILFFVLVAPFFGQTQDFEPTTILVNVPGADGTYPMAINAEGDITGFDLGIPSSGFLRICHQDCDNDNYNPIVKINVPGASFTMPTNINDKRTITGNYDGSRGFVRQCMNTEGEVTCNDDGSSYTTFAAPHARYTFPQSINSAGDITGWYVNSRNASHGFLRVCGKSTHPYCRYTIFDPAPPPNGTMPCCINAMGVITGEYGIPGEALHGFIRHVDRTLENIDVPGYVQTEPFSINVKGEITGIYYDVAFENVGAFLREPDGQITTFTVPGAFVTYASSINDSGTIAGFYYDPYPSLSAGGFTRAPDGRITLFRIPDSAPYLVRINNSGAIVGMYRDKGFSGHGFLRLPQSNKTSRPDGK
jgi:hypothetical protein